jgi:hypothetical protein
MERWRIPDAMALELIEFPGKLGASGKRPRFRFTTRQQRITSYLPEIAIPDGKKSSTNLHILMNWQKHDGEWNLLSRASTKL